MAIDPQLLNVKPISEITTVDNPTEGHLLFYDGSDELKKVDIVEFQSYVDDVLEYANLASFPATGENGKIYIAIDTNLTYRWGGSSYVVMSSSLALGETSSTAYRGDRGKIAYDHSQATGNPHGTTKTDIGLGNVDNTSDLNKPISTATQTVLNNKLDKGTYTGNASDLKSLIDTKADLVGGKVPKAQSQPSTMVMDSSTYVITFTDATGAVQTIDLPLESLFKDANYNSSTKSLIVTLQDGTTRTIPLTDLVDLPEIVLSTSNPAVTPTTGQKVYFNTSLGKVWFNVGGTWSGGYSLINTITSNVTSTTTVGAINAGDIIPAGTTIQELAELIFNKTFYPTFVNPTFGLTNNAGIREVGSSFNVTLTFNFNRGQILGKLDNGIWNQTMLQDYRAGIATSYLLNGVSGSNNSASFNVTTVLGTNTLNGSVTYGIGVQPKDSKNNNYDNPLPSGTSPIQSTSFEGIYPYFYYKYTSPITPAIMQSAIANGQAIKVLASSTGTITVDFDANGEYIAVAYPATSTTKTIWYVNALDNGEIPGGVLGSENTLPCNSPENLWNNVLFKIHVSPGLLTQSNPIQLKNS